MSTYPQPLPANQPSGAERVARATGSVNTVRTCTACGGGWFHVVACRQYNATAYSSAIGGDLQAVGEMPIEIAVCLCGEPSMPKIGGIRGGRTGTETQASFMLSLTRAVEHRQTQRQSEAADLQKLVEKAVSGLANDFVMRSELESKPAPSGSITKEQISAGTISAPEVQEPVEETAKPVRLGRPPQHKG